MESILKQDQKYKQSQKQSLKLSQVMKQALSFLTFSNVELEEEIKKIALDNPLIDIEYTYSNTFDITNDFVDPNKISLTETIYNQLSLNKEKINFQIVNEILDKCDTNGYFKGNIYYIGKKYKLSVKEVQKIRYKIMECKPYGIASLDLKECLLMQIKELNNKLVRKIIEEGLSLLGEMKIQELQVKFHASEEEIKNSIKIIQRLNPRPAREFLNDTIKYIKPELKIIKNGNSFDVIPIHYFNLKINGIVNQNLNKEDQKIIGVYTKQASYLKTNLKRREETLITCFKEIVKIQRHYLDGTSAKEICTLDMLAKKVNRNISTISRALQDKYYEYLDEIYPIKSLLAKEVCGVSEEYYCKVLMELIKVNNNYSDYQLSLKMNEKGINTSRRTISKYRKLLNIKTKYERTIDK